MAVSSVSGTQNPVPIVDADKTGFSGLTSQDFLKLLISQLQNQDPTNPLDSDQLLQQISEMRNLQSGIELDSALKSLTSTQQLAGATSFIGKNITALHGTDQKEVSGVVDRVKISDGKASLFIGDQEVGLDEVVAVAA